MKPLDKSERNWYEIIGTAVKGQTGTVIIGHCNDAVEAIRAYDCAVESKAWMDVWIRKRHVVETVTNDTPPGFTVFIKWTRDYEGEDDRYDFLTRDPALAFAQVGNDPKVMKSVYVFDHREQRTVYAWPEK